MPTFGLPTDDFEQENFMKTTINPRNTRQPRWQPLPTSRIPPPKAGMSNEYKARAAFTGSDRGNLAIRNMNEGLFNSKNGPMFKTLQIVQKPKIQFIRPRITPVFGPTMASMKGIASKEPIKEQRINWNLKKIDFKKSEEKRSTNNITKSEETVFFPQTSVKSFALDEYNGSRPSFAFEPFSAQTSTPITKNRRKISENSSIFEEDESKYVTAMESPVALVRKK